MSEQSMIAYLRYMFMANKSKAMDIHKHPAVRDIETKLFKDYMQSVRVNKVAHVN